MSTNTEIANLRRCAAYTASAVAALAIFSVGMAALWSPQGAPGIASACGALLTGMRTCFLWLVTAGTFRLSGVSAWFYALGAVYACLFCAGYKTLLHLRNNEVRSKRSAVPYPEMLNAAIEVGASVAIIGVLLLIFHLVYWIIDFDAGVTAHRYMFDPAESFYGRLEQILLALSHLLFIGGVYGTCVALDTKTCS